MRGIEKIVDQILEEANDKKAAIESDAKNIVSQIEGKAKEEAIKIKEEIDKGSIQEAKNYENLAILAAEQKKRRAVLETKQKLIGEILEKSYETLLGLEDIKYFDLINKMIEKYALDKEGKIVFGKKDLARLPENYQKTLDIIANAKGGSLIISQEAGKFNGGFILIYGGIEENCTFKALMESDKEDLQDIVHEKLFG